MIAQYVKLLHLWGGKNRFGPVLHLRSIDIVPNTCTTTADGQIRNSGRTMTDCTYALEDEYGADPTLLIEKKNFLMIHSLY
jgi:hypothetical protein